MDSTGTVYPANIHLKKVLKSYQSAASSSLSGPNAILAVYRLPSGAAGAAEAAAAESIGADADCKPRILADEFQTLKLKRHKSQREIHPPIFTAADRSWTEWSETRIEGQPIACFVVGGEKRLCLPQVMNSVLGQFHISEINAACDELHIYCSLCSPQQLEMLKSAGILPVTASSCGLITSTDAQRLCSLLLRKPSRILNGSTGVPDRTRQQQRQQQQQHPGWFRVYHECFGKCEGICKPELYVSSTAACIECSDCGLLVSPQHFVGHAHRGLQNRTCHWGFDAQAWRSYLLLARRQTGYDLLLRQLEKFKAKFAAAEQQHGGTGSFKRKQKVEEPCVLHPDSKTLWKKCKEEPEERIPDYLGWFSPMSKQLEPPPLKICQSQQYELDTLDRFYQPNVTLESPGVREKMKAVTSAAAAPPPPSYNPEIELSSTDTDDSESLVEEKEKVLGSSLTPELAEELSRIEESLRIGGCNPAEGESILQAFKRLCVRVMSTEEQLDWRRQQQQLTEISKWREAAQMSRCTVDISSKVKQEPVLHYS